jgi:acetylornithine deacetylase/succinyl-diaminopimelate desuccinylase-like protein
VHAAAQCAALVSQWPVPGMPRTTLGVARIGGGSAINAIASDAWLEIDARSTSAAMLDRLEREVRRLAHLAVTREQQRAAPGLGTLSAQCELTGSRPAGALDASHALVRAAELATRAIGRRPVAATASTDANVPLSVGIPAVAMGAGGAGGGAHTVEEWFENVDGAAGVARVLGTILAVAA